MSGASHLAGEVVLIRPGSSFDIGRWLNRYLGRYVGGQVGRYMYVGTCTRQNKKKNKSQESEKNSVLIS